MSGDFSHPLMGLMGAVKRKKKPTKAKRAFRAFATGGLSLLKKNKGQKRSNKARRAFAAFATGGMSLMKKRPGQKKPGKAKRKLKTIFSTIATGGVGGIAAAVRRRKQKKAAKKKAAELRRRLASVPVSSSAPSIAPAPVARTVAPPGQLLKRAAAPVPEAETEPEAVTENMGLGKKALVPLLVAAGLAAVPFLLGRD